MRSIHAMERRLQDLERKFENKERLGRIVDVKYDEEKHRWYVKLNDGDDLKPSGSNEQSGSEGSGQSGGSGEKSDPTTFKSDWLPWSSFSHGTIKRSVPPKKGMQAVLRSVGGSPELGTVEPHFNNPNNPSPHGKPDEIVQVVEDDDDDEDQKQSGGSNGSQGQGDDQKEKWHTWTHETKNSHHLIIQKKKKNTQGSGSQQSGSAGSSSGQGGKQAKSRKLPEVEEDGDDATLQVKASKDGWLLTHGKTKAKIKVSGDDITIQQEKMSIKITKDETTISKGDAKLIVKEDKIQGTVGGDSGGKLLVKQRGAKIAKSRDFIAVGEGGCFASKDIVVGPDPVGDD